MFMELVKYSKYLEHHSIKKWSNLVIINCISIEVNKLSIWMTRLLKV